MCICSNCKIHLFEYKLVFIGKSRHHGSKKIEHKGRGGVCPNYEMYLSKLYHVFVRIVICICLNFKIYLLAIAADMGARKLGIRGAAGLTRVNQSMLTHFPHKWVNKRSETFVLMQKAPLFPQFLMKRKKIWKLSWLKLSASFHSEQQGW